ncbi:MAG: hypothetical protein A2Y62_07690 [Candidatus Fischerbacteria bacterium RBG_13_37_8]|uniref:DUF5723 domain-containing protein n=1 Tax=Candidatus Fischerbacteria bacterium RBG_13_37_8 TaxID=1817863 RepID=A0A1F5V9F1_9BACT|nr:MAG: hypothetical protein A2Y62_07690 [Candidatus Fischerbacteria bacterium RBG_13_37_8]
MKFTDIGFERKWKILLLSCLFILCVGSSLVFSQTDASIFQFFTINDMYYGGRSVAMGCTANALGYDVASSRSNPGNLINIPKNIAEVDISYNTYNRTVYDDEFSFSSTTPAFFGMALNYGSISFSFFQEKMFKMEETFYSLGRQLPLEFNAPGLNTQRNIDLTTRGFNVALLLTGDLAIGIGFRRGDLKLQANSYRDALFVETGYDTVNSSIDINDDDSAWSFGVLLQPRGDFRIGAAYHLGLSYSIIETRSYFESQNTIKAETLEYQFNTPRSLKLGAALDFKRLMLAFDYSLIYYSDILKDGMKILDITVDGNAFTAKNSKELHLGVEFPLTIGKTNVLFLRGGMQYLPFKGIHYTGSSGNSVLDEILKAMYPENDAKIGMSFGSGINLKQAVFIDVGFMMSSTRKDMVITGGYNF